MINPNSYRILSFDGGGIKGVVSMVALEELDKRRAAATGGSGSLLDEVDLIAGTSAGALNTLGLGLGLSPAQMIGLYQTEGKVIFPKDFLSSSLSLNGILSARFRSESLRKGILEGLAKSGVVFAKPVETYTLGDLPRENVFGRPRRHLFTSFQLDSGEADSNRTWKAKIFHDFPNDNGLDAQGNPIPNPDVKENAIDVAMRSAAAPGLFPIYQGYVDGALLANNPSMCAIAQALNNETGNQMDNDLRVLSIGTGRGPGRYLPNKNDSWGFADWAKHLDMFIDAVVGVAHFQSKQVLGSCYTRVDPILRAEYDAGDGSAVERLIAETWRYFSGPEGQKLLGDFDVWLTKRWFT